MNIDAFLLNEADTPELRRTTARSGGALFLAGGILGYFAVSVPQPTGFRSHPLMVVSSFAVVTALGFFIAGPRVPAPALYCVLAVLGPVAISVAAYYSGPVGSPFVVMLYVWTAAFIFCFFTGRAGGLTVAWIGACYATLLTVQRGNEGAVYRWTVTMTSVAVTGIFLNWLVRRLKASTARERQARAEAEAAKAALEVASQHKSDFLANMSHELRTPLNAIIGFSEVLRERMFGELTERQDEYLGDILGSGQHLLALINDILDLSKVEAGKMELELADVHLPEVLESGLSLLRERAGRQGVTLHLDVDSSLGVVEADERRLKQVVFNLLTNAVKFTPEGGAVTLSAHAAGDELIVAVTDTGVGIAADEQEKVFQEFGQASGSATMAKEGTGLGLPLAKRFVELHGGRMWLDSKPGVGSTFSFAIPLRRVKQPLRPEELAATGMPTVLLVEDDPGATELLTIYLRGGGFQVVSAADGEEGLATARLLHPDVIALDVVLPKLDGWDFLAAAKADPFLCDIPVVVLSMLDERGRGFALGASEYLVKPVSRQDVLGAFGHLLRRPQRVLAIDDDPRAIELVRAILEPEGITLLTATGGAEGIETARRERPDLVVVDLMMPTVDGFEVIEALRGDHATADTPVVVLTSKTLTADDKRRLNAHMAHLAAKGDLDRAAFVQLVRSCCTSAAA